MAARAIWKGTLMLAREEIPVKVYSAIEDRTVRFNVLEKSTMARIKQQMVNPETGDAVPWDQIQKGYEIEPGTFVLLTDEEIKKSQPPESRSITITQFVPANLIQHQWYDRPYYLGPDGAASGPYFALAEALERKGREGIAHWVMRGNAYIGALRSENGYLMLITMNYAEEILSASDLPTPKASRPPDRKEMKMAEQLVTAMEGEFKPEDFHDEYRERVMKFIEAKTHGHKPKLKTTARRRPTKSLLASLAASIKSVRRGGVGRVA
jgi:DNA end-binding protein Ku